MSQVTAKEILFKQPIEVVKYTMDFTNKLGANDILSGIISASGNPAGLGISNTGFDADNTIVELTIASGTDNTNYRVEITVSTTGGQTFQGDGQLYVRDS